MDYTDQELSIAVEAFDKSLEAKNSATSKLTADKNKKAGEAFLAKNEKEKGVQITSSGLQFKVLKSGDGKSPQKTDRVRVHYHGMLPDGSAFDSSKQRGDAVEFAVTSVIKGWTEALLQMKVGDKWVIYVPSDLAYGARRRSDVIGPNQVVMFEIELLEIVAARNTATTSKR
jgi:FKBP-type peptidyl-prolyl cis-trans isomerase FklB